MRVCRPIAVPESPRSVVGFSLKAADPTLYHIHVIYALAFAVKGHWYASLTLAKIAMTICDSIDPAARGFLLGREAAYLACIAVRRSATNRSHLNEAAQYLDQAIRRENEGVMEDIRFNT